MVRPYGVKGKKRKKNREVYDKEEEVHEEIEVGVDDEEENVAKRSKAEEDEDEAKAQQVADELSGIPIGPLDQDDKKNGVIFILERASLEVAKVGKTYQLLNSDEHANFLKRNNKNPADYRPDIAHQAMLMILDSTLNKAGKLRALYVRTEKGVLFEVKPHVRIPRTYKRFSGIILQLLQKLSISAVGKREKLLRVIKNPVTQYLPVNSRRIGFSHSSEKLVDIGDYVNAVSNDVNLVFVLGAMAHGKIEKEFVDDFISISAYPLSAAYCISKITNALERKWKIL
ncbi:Nucleolar essential protein-related [Heracleum sosnowskyi]|uniref:Nucleolar essential protein-related n=1 Tax=Heracleum sosnowskyi TaxID=360622 RepID=A0AAD8JIJ8_9APIA|nr:Nucleolar essential protein-related [Heracleum sosnowskyi]